MEKSENDIKTEEIGESQQQSQQQNVSGIPEKEIEVSEAKKPRIDLKTIPPRYYLDYTVVPILLHGLSYISKERPEDAIGALADYLLTHKAKFEQLSTQVIASSISAQGQVPGTTNITTLTSISSSISVTTPTTASVSATEPIVVDTVTPITTSGSVVEQQPQQLLSETKVEENNFEVKMETGLSETEKAPISDSNENHNEEKSEVVRESAQVSIKATNGESTES